MILSNSSKDAIAWFSCIMFIGGMSAWNLFHAGFVLCEVESWLTSDP